MVKEEVAAAVSALVSGRLICKSRQTCSTLLWPLSQNLSQISSYRIVLLIQCSALKVRDKQTWLSLTNSQPSGTSLFPLPNQTYYVHQRYLTFFSRVLLTYLLPGVCNYSLEHLEDFCSIRFSSLKVKVSEIQLSKICSEISLLFVYSVLVQWIVFRPVQIHAGATFYLPFSIEKIFEANL